MSNAYTDGLVLKPGDTLQVTSNLQIGADGEAKSDPTHFSLNGVLFIRQTTAEANTRKAVREVLDMLHSTLFSAAPWRSHIEIPTVDRAIKELLTQYQDQQPKATE